MAEAATIECSTTHLLLLQITHHILAQLTLQSNNSGDGLTKAWSYSIHLSPDDGYKTAYSYSIHLRPDDGYKTASSYAPDSYNCLSHMLL